ncbi:acyl-CoA dehydrogenase family protein [Rhodobacteraceae bacterium KMM 6894]|nr:acyl-CoA dehydrogenase family protein [Rhodobacteraceae bacterium KMM 6894]
MTQSRPHNETDTHAVTNQPEPRGDLNLWAGDAALRDHSFAADADHLALYGRKMGRADMRAAGVQVDRHPPEPRLFDAGGRRLDEVTYHPAYHTLMQAGLGAGYAALPWEGATGGHSTHAAMVYLTTQTAPGACIPMSMTYAAVPALRASKALLADWVPKLTARMYDPSVGPLASKTAATMGLALTEKQGGSDLSGISTRAVRDGDTYRLRGHKWFCSAPMADGFLTLAQAPGGLTAFVVPRWCADVRNTVHIQRLKDTLGNRATACAEIEFADALAHPLGDEGDGLRHVMDMVHHTRLDAALAPAGIMRAALSKAHYWAQYRSIGQTQLIDKPLMRNVLADLALDWEATLALGLHVARAFDGKREADRAFAHLSVGLAKFMGNKLAPGVVCEAMEALGGMGYVEDTGLPMLLRDAPLNALWEGSGNVLCLDILRTLRVTPLSGEVLGRELGEVTGQYRHYDAALHAHMQRFPHLPDEAQARWYVASLATLLAASVLMRHAPTAIAEAYITTRLSGARGPVAGAISGVDTDAILDRLT